MPRMVQPCVPVERRMTLSSSSRSQAKVGLSCAEDGREQIYPKATARFYSLTMSVSYDSYVSYLSYLFERNGIAWCALRVFAQRNNVMSVEGRNGRERNRRYCLGRVGLTRHL